MHIFINRNYVVYEDKVEYSSTYIKFQEEK